MKKVLKSLSKKTIGLLMSFAMVFSLILPVSKIIAAAPDEANTYGRFIMNGALDVQEVTNADQVIGTYEHGTFTIDGHGLYVDSNDKSIYAKGSIYITTTPEQGYNSTIWINGTDQQQSAMSIDAIQANYVYNIDCEFTENGGGQPQPAGNTHATINVSTGEGTYEITRPNQETHEPEVVSVPYDDQIDLRINGIMWDHEAGNEIDYSTNPTDTTVVMTFETLWINRYYDNIVINGTSYPVIDYIDFDDRTSWLEHNNGTQMVTFSITNVPKADTYNIVVKHGENNGERFISTFLWTADPDQATGPNYIGHAKLELVKAVYFVGNETFTVTEDDIKDNLVEEGEFLTYRSLDGFMSYGVKKDVDFDDGSLTLPGEAEVTMRVVPDYGYQVTSVNGGENFETTDEGVSEFTVVVHHGEAGYFQAEVTEVPNEVKTNSEKVTAGTVKISDGEIDSGTVRLYVDDVELSSDKIKGFEKAAGDYKISSYLDINLSQVFYKGTEDGEDVWDEEIHKLNKNATITLKLAEGIDVNDIVIVHNIGNGDEYEVIEIDSYNPKTRVIKFRTKSFSNYAIAFKDTAKEDSSKGNPKTGDNIMIYFMMLSLVGAGLYIKKKRFN